MGTSPRIDELRRRVERDPASIAFAQLAEEHRRAGSFDDAVATCRRGLALHPGYVSARVTLGRSLIEIGQLESAESELTLVLKTAPGNLAANRGLADIYRRRGDLGQALGFYRTALTLAPGDPELEQAVEQLTSTVAPDLADAIDEVANEDRSPDADSSRGDAPFVAAAVWSGLPQLERFLGAIHTYRQRRAV